MWRLLLQKERGGVMHVCYPQHTLLGELESQASLLVADNFVG
jgi:hypothetical protein